MRFKDYKSNGAVTVLPDMIANQLITTYDIAAPFNFSPEGYLNIIAHSSLDEIDATLPGIITALTYLNKKLEASRKTISFWDAYQIQDTIEDKEQMLGQLSNMPVNTSIVSNLRDPFTWLNESNQQETIYRGDLLIKDYNGRIHLVHGTSQGAYKPTTITQSGQAYTINYTYTESAQVGDSVDISLNIPGVPDGYNDTRLISADTTDTSVSVINNMVPVVKYFTANTVGDETTFEQVILDKVFVIDGATINLPNVTSIDLVAEVK